MHPRRETRSLDIRRQSFDRLDRRRSAELCRSTRRYDEFWGAAEKSDTRIKCKDGTIHHVHSQMCILWSPVLRDIISLYPTPALLESTHGLAYLLHVEEEGATWAAVLDHMYPVPLQQQAATDWALLERCLLLADKYDMACVMQRLAGRLAEPCTAYSMDPAAPNFALSWLSLAERLQLPGVAGRILADLRSGLQQLGSQPGATAALLAYAQEHLSKEQLLQLLQISMQAANSHQQQQHVCMQPPQQTLYAAFNGWLGQGQSSGSGSQGMVQQQQQQTMQQQQQQLMWQAPVPLFNQGQQQPAASTSCSGTSSDPTVGESVGCSDEGSSDNGCGAADSKQQQRELYTEQQRLQLCMSSDLFAPVALQQQQGCVSRAASPAISSAAPAGSAQERAVCSALPVPRYPVAQAAAPNTATQRPFLMQQAQQAGFGSQGEGFGFGVNGGSASIADWMRSQPEGMCWS